MKNVIYIIKNSVNERIYVGSAVKFNIRVNQHSHHLKKGTHHNPPLQNFVNKYGFDKIEFKIIEKDCNNLIEREQYFIDALNPYFNVNLVAQSPKGLKRTPKQIQNIIDGRMRNGGFRSGFIVSKETRAKIGDAHRGKEISLEHKESISKANTGRVVSEKVKVKISKALKGRQFSKEHKSKLSDSAKGNTNWKNTNYNDPIRVKKISEAMKKRMSKKVINIKTGEIYPSAITVSNMIGMPRSTFTKHLSGYTKINKTDYEYYND